MSADLITQHFQARKTDRRDVKNQGKRSEATPKVSPDVKWDVSKEDDMKILKDFDLKWEFGPCIGVTRLERWQRAHKHGLNPSQEVKDLVLQHLDDKDYTESLWHEYNI